MLIGACNPMLQPIHVCRTFGKMVDVDANNGKTASNFLYVFPKDHYVITFMSFLLVGTITLLYAVINFPFLAALTEIINMLPGCGNFDIIWGPFLANSSALCDPMRAVCAAQYNNKITIISINNIY